MNLKYMKISLFKIKLEKKLTFPPQHSDIFLDASVIYIIFTSQTIVLILVSIRFQLLYISVFFTSFFIIVGNFLRISNRKIHF